MRFGIDVGTTRTIIAAVDRGNYPILNVEDALGDSHEYIPSIVALDGERIIAGWQVNPDSTTAARSFKRVLSERHVTPDTPVRLGEETRSIAEVLDAFAAHIIEQLLAYQRRLGDTSTPEVIIGVPANAHSAQRLLTLSAFSQAGVRVIGLVNEPSAAAFEYTHRHARTLNSKRQSIIVYDLGGGTFDASLIRVEGKNHEVLGTLGISRLGGDDFDEALAGCALEVTDRTHDAFGARARRRLLDEARTAKEALVPQSRRILLTLDDADVTVPVSSFYEQVTPLVEKTLAVTQPLVGDLRDSDIAGIYLVGGASALPLVPRMLRERFGHRVHRSPNPGGSTAVGLAIAADPGSGFHLSDRVSRGIGVFREWDCGSTVSFDPLISPDTPGPVEVIRRYRAAHNIGWFRFVEYSTVDEQEGFPGDISLLTEVKVPFDPDADLDGPVTRFEGPEVEETITVNSDGIASIRIAVADGPTVVFNQ